MAFSRTSLTLALSLLLLITLSASTHLLVDAAYHREMVSLVGQSTSTKIDCGSECKRRCRLSSRPNLCNRACGTCCGRCGCVPPGTYGNKEVCPCYAQMTTRGGRPKCP